MCLNLQPVASVRTTAARALQVGCRRIAAGPIERLVGPLIHRRSYLASQLYGPLMGPVFTTTDPLFTTMKDGRIQLLRPGVCLFAPHSKAPPPQVPPCPPAPLVSLAARCAARRLEPCQSCLPLRRASRLEHHALGCAAPRPHISARAVGRSPKASFPRRGGFPSP